MEEISAEVRDLVRRHVTSGDHLEVLMRMHTDADRSFTNEELRQATHISEAGVARVLHDLAAAGIIREADGDRYQYHPRTVLARQALDQLAQLYHQRPVTLVRLVYERPSAPLNAFSDAFRLRDPKDPKDSRS